MTDEKMDIKTPEGTAKGMPLSDIQENNKLIRRLIYTIAIVGGGFLLVVIYVLWQIDRYNMFSNLVKAIARGGGVG